MKITDLGGTWTVRTINGKIYKAMLPGTLDENGIGHKDNVLHQWKPMEVDKTKEKDNILLKHSKVITTRFTRKYSYEGEAVFTKEFAYQAEQNGKCGRLFLEAERSRKLELIVNGSRVNPYTCGTMSTPYVFEITEKLGNESRMELICDNSYHGWPKDSIRFSSAATDETQTNWNGILGYLQLRREDNAFLSAIRAYPKEGKLTVQVDIDTAFPYQGTLQITSKALRGELIKQISLTEGRHTLTFDALLLKENCRQWDEYEGNLYELSVTASNLERKSIIFGIRDFGDNGKGRLALNGRTIFLRSETNCCVFPETGHMPFSVAEWEDILNRYKAYGVNCVRFHSHCPPDAAFTAADKIGLLLQPELSHWNYKTAFGDEESLDYFELELRQLLLTYANHPSFVMLTFGNELQADELGHKRMDALLSLARSIDPTRMYANGSNVHYGMQGADQNSDFYTSSNFYENKLRGTFYGMTGYINECYPGSKTNYDKVMAEVRKEFRKPVFSFEVGQYESLPDFEELDEFQGVTLANNLALIKREAIERGMLPEWKKRVEATGELARLAYREEIEAVLRTGELSGISLLGLQDFPGQGTALIGMMNSHLIPKPFSFASPQKFREFFTDVLPLVLLDRYTYTNEETVEVDLELANYGKKSIVIPAVCELKENDKTLQQLELPAIHCPCGQTTVIGKLSLPLHKITTAKKLLLSVQVGEYRNEYPLWVYPKQQVEAFDTVIVTQSFAETIEALRDGNTVFYSPKADQEHFPNSIASQFTTDFWSVGTFPAQEGCMGCLMDPAHPVFNEFPTDFHTNWQWWPMTKGRAMVLTEDIKPLITVIDCYARLRNLGFLFECRVGSAKLIVSSMGLLEKQKYPEARALYFSILKYMSSGQFVPACVLTLEELKNILGLT